MSEESSPSGEAGGEGQETQSSAEETSADDDEGAAEEKQEASLEERVAAENKGEAKTTDGSYSASATPGYANKKSNGSKNKGADKKGSVSDEEKKENKEEDDKRPVIKDYYSENPEIDRMIRDIREKEKYRKGAGYPEWVVYRGSEEHRTSSPNRKLLKTNPKDLYKPARLHDTSRYEVISNGVLRYKAA